MRQTASAATAPWLGPRPAPPTGRLPAWKVVNVSEKVAGDQGKRQWKIEAKGSGMSRQKAVGCRGNQGRVV